MTEKMDKSLEDIISEQRTKSKPRVRSGGDRTEGAARGSDRRNARPDSRREAKRDVGRMHVEAAPPPREPQYYMHDDRAGGFGGRGQQGGGVPRGSWKQQQRQQWEQQQQWERPRGRGAAAAGDPIITTADGWEEVAQDDPYPSDRRGGSGAQRRGGVFERLTPSRGQGGGHNTRSYDRQQQQQQFGGRFGRGRGRGGFGGRGRGGDFEGEQRRKYIDEHDHREDASAGPAGRPGRFAPYRVAGGVSKRTGRGPASAGRKWAHDMFDPNQPAPAAGGDEGGDGMME